NNPIRFGNLQAPSSIVLLIAGSGAISGNIDAAQLGISGIGGSANITGTIGGNSTQSAAQLAVIDPGISNQYLFNTCTIGAVGCGLFVDINPITASDILTARPQIIEDIVAATSQRTQSEIDILLSRPREFDRYTGRPQDEDLIAPLINVFDEERLCEELRRTSPEAAQEVCR